MWDTYGWTGGNWNKEFDFLLSGALRDGYKEQSDLNGQIDPNPTLADQVHGVLIICEMSRVNTMSEMNILQDFFQKLTVKGIINLINIFFYS